MNRIRYYFLPVFFISIVITLYHRMSFAEDNTIKNNPQEQKVTERYDKIKKKQSKDYKTGAYNDNKKDYVKKWISEDINYHKRVIKLKSDYLSWAKERLAKNQAVNFYEYESLKDLSDAEKKILLEYHNSHFKNKTKRKPKVSKNIGAGKNKKPARTQIAEIKEDIINKNDNIKPDDFNSKEFDNSGNNFIFILFGILSVIIIILAFILFRKKK